MNIQKITAFCLILLITIFFNAIILLIMTNGEQAFPFNDFSIMQWVSQVLYWAFSICLSITLSDKKSWG